MSKRYLIHSTEPISIDAAKCIIISLLPSYSAILHDEMTESIYHAPLTSFATTALPEEVQEIDVLHAGETAIERVRPSPSLLRRSAARGRSRCPRTRSL